MPATYWEFSRIAPALWPAPGPILTKSSKLLDVGMESLLAGCVSSLHSATSEVAVYWTAIIPLANPGFDPRTTRKGGRPLLSDGSRRAEVLRSEMLAKLDSASDMNSRAIATGWP